MSTGIARNDSVEVKFTLPDGIPSETKLQISLTNSNGEAVSDALPQLSIENASYRNITGDEFSIPLGKKDFRIKLLFKRATKDNETIYLNLIPITNKDWFIEKEYKTKIVFRDNFLINEFTKPTDLVAIEKEDLIFDTSFSYPLENDLSLNLKIAHITTTNSNVNKVLISFNNGITYTELINNSNTVIPKGTKDIKFKVPILDDQQLVDNKKFEIILEERDIPNITTINRNKKITVTITDTTILHHGTLIRTYCTGYDQYGEYADGLGGTYHSLIKANSTSCGYVIPPSGTVLMEYCAGTTKVRHVANGRDGFTKSISGFRHSDCEDSYGTNPLTTDVTSTRLVGRHGTPSLGPDNDVFNGTVGNKVISEFRTMFGKWYFEVEIYLPKDFIKPINLGFATDKINYDNFIGKDRFGYAWHIDKQKKYHEDIEEDYVTTIPVKDKDVISVLLNNLNNSFDLWLNGNNLGTVYDTLPNEKLAFIIESLDDSWCFVNFGKYEFKHSPPADYYKGFGAVPNPPADLGTLISTRCDGTTYVKVFADGKGSTYEESTINHRDCGYIPPAGTIIGEHCEGTKLYNKIADGQDGFTLKFVEYNSTKCGYVKPSLGNINFTTFDDVNIKAGSTLSADKLTADFTGKISTDYTTDFGIWYIEYTNWDSNSYLGITWDKTEYDTNDFNSFVGYDPVSGNIHDSSGSTNIGPALSPTDVVGISLDFVKQESVIYVNGVKVGTLKEELNYPNNTNRKYGFAVMSKDPNIESHVVANFGQTTLDNTPNNHYPGFGQGSHAYPRRGIKIHDWCEHWTKYHVYTNGNGGTFNQLFENDSADCGWYPDPPIGTILGTVCKGVDKYNKIATGNYQFREELFKAKDPDCGWTPYGTLLSWYCEGYTKMGKYSDGEGSHYNAVLERDSKDCGAPVPSEGTVLREFCAGSTKTQHIANGSGGYRVHVLEYQSSDCGYVAPTPNPQDVLIPTKFVAPKSDSQSNQTAVVSNGGQDIQGQLRHGGYTEYYTIFGKWYFEVKAIMANEYATPPALGVATTYYSINSWLGAHDDGYGWWPHDGTKFHNDTQGFYNRGLVIENNDIIGVKLDLQETQSIEFFKNGESLGIMYDILPNDKYMRFVFNSTGDSYISANFGQDEFVHEVPDGYYPGFGKLKNPPPERNTLLSTFCSDTEKWGKYADGKFGSYDKLIQKDSAECGWVPPNPPAGTVLRYECQGYDRYIVTADGVGGEIKTLYDLNSTYCGYVRPVVSNVRNNGLDDTRITSNTVITGDNTATVDGTIFTKDGNYSALWYYEVKVKDLNTVIGITSNRDTYTTHPGTYDNSQGWAIGFNKLFKDNVESDLEPNLDIEVDDVIGVVIDSINEEVRINVNNGEFRKLFSIPTLESGYYFLAFGNYDSSTNTEIEVNLKESELEYSPPNSFYPGWGVPNIRPYRKGYIHGYMCRGQDRYASIADGNSGRLSQLIETNSTNCGYVPPPVAGTIIGYYCVGLEYWKRIADGNGGFTTELEEQRSTKCGYKPAGTLLGTYCNGYDKIGKFSDGEGGFYEQLMQADSRDCGFDNGSGTNTNVLDPTLDVTHPEGLTFTSFVDPNVREIVFKDTL